MSDTIADKIRALVDQAPPLSDEQRAVLSRLLTAGGEAA